ncbi:phosphotransferase family protein [Blastococcus sp. SYSU D00669]
MRPPVARVAAALSAARAVAAAHGLRTDDARVLHDGANVVVDLAPAPVVARVATLTAVVRPDVGVPFGREVALATALDAAGAAVVPPSDVLPPGPHRHAGSVLSFWTRVEVLPDRPGPREAGGALARLHEVLGALPVPATPPLDTPLDDLAAFAARGARWRVPAPLLDRLAARLAELRPRLVGSVRQLHGDPHPGNLLATAIGWRWADLEDTCAGPLEWDLACLRSTRRLDGRAALDAFPGAPSDAALAPWLELRRLHAAVWGVVIDAEHGRSPARDGLEAALAGRSAR